MRIFFKLEAIVEIIIAILYAFYLTLDDQTLQILSKAQIAIGGNCLLIIIRHLDQITLVDCLHYQGHDVEFHLNLPELSVLEETCEMANFLRFLVVVDIEVAWNDLLDVFVVGLLARTEKDVSERGCVVGYLAFVVHDAVDRSRTQLLRSHRSDEDVLVVGRKTCPLKLQLHGEDIAIAVFAEEQPLIGVIFLPLLLQEISEDLVMDICNHCGHDGIYPETKHFLSREAKDITGLLIDHEDVSQFAFAEADHNEACF
jgi:hypothetical protein